MTDRPDAADYGEAFLDVAREWESEPGEFGSRAHSLHALDFVRAVEARAAQYAAAPAAEASLVIETDWNNLDARGVIRQTGVGMPQVWARDGDEEVLIVGYAVDWSTQRPALRDLNATYAAAQYAERPRHEPDCPCEDCDIAASAG